MKILSRRWSLTATAALAVTASAVLASGAFAGPNATPAKAGNLGPTTGLLPRDHLTLENAIQVDLSKETVRLPLYRGIAYKGTPNQETVWYVLLDASDAGLAHDLGVNYAPKLANLAVGCPECVQTVTLDSPTPQQNRFGQAVVNFQGAPDFSPTRIAEPGPNGFPLAKFQPGAVAGPGLGDVGEHLGGSVAGGQPRHAQLGVPVFGERCGYLQRFADVGTGGQLGPQAAHQVVPERLPLAVLDRHRVLMLEQRRPLGGLPVEAGARPLPLCPHLAHRVLDERGLAQPVPVAQGEETALDRLVHEPADPHLAGGELLEDVESTDEGVGVDVPAAPGAVILVEIAPAALLEHVVAGARPGELVDEVGHGLSIASAAGNRDGVRAVSVRGGA